MWKCQKCGENHDDTFAICWSCGTNKDGSPSENTAAFEKERRTATISEQQQVASELENPEYYCTDCGAIVKLEDSVCPSCGANLDETESTIELTGKSLGDFFSFHTMISTTLVKVIYALGLVIITVSGIGMIVRATQAQQASGEQIWLGIAIVVFGNLLWRLICEGSIVIFNIHEQLRSIDRQLKNR
jgi:uncharacterized membrane protein YvbJ